MKSALDTHNYQPSDFNNVDVTPEKAALTVNCKPSMATKIRDLSSDILGTGDSMQKHFDADHTKNQVVDLDIKGLPGSTQAEDLKRISGVKHVISSIVDTNSLTNACTGTGRIKMRLSPNEDLDTVKLQYLKAGFGVAEHSDNPNKKS